jgi:hypothetical protein
MSLQHAPLRMPLLLRTPEHHHRSGDALLVARVAHSFHCSICVCKSVHLCGS